jgi:hypothetical protein
MIGVKTRDPNYYDKNPEILAGEQKLCATVIIVVGIIITILYFTVGIGSK